MSLEHKKTKLACIKRSCPLQLHADSNARSIASNSIVRVAASSLRRCCVGEPRNGPGCAPCRGSAPPSTPVSARILCNLFVDFDSSSEPPCYLLLGMCYVQSLLSSRRTNSQSRPCPQSSIVSPHSWQTRVLPPRVVCDTLFWYSLRSSSGVLCDFRDTSCMSARREGASQPLNTFAPLCTCSHHDENFVFRSKRLRARRAHLLHVDARVRVGNGQTRPCHPEIRVPAPLILVL